MAISKKAKGKKKKRNKSEFQLNQPVEELVRHLLKTYDRMCKEMCQQMCPTIRNSLKEAIENEQLVTRFIISPAPPPRLKSSQILPGIPPPCPPSPVRLWTFISALETSRYQYVKDIHIWDLSLDVVVVADLAILIEKKFFKYLRLLEFMACDLDFRSVQRIGECLKRTKVTHLILDYNKFSDKGVNLLCNALVSNKKLLHLSMCSCHITATSSKALGDLIATTAINELYLNSNSLGCDGFFNIIEKLSLQAAEDEAKRIIIKEHKEQELILKMQNDEMEKNIVVATGQNMEKESIANVVRPKSKKKKTKKSKNSAPALPLPIGPFLTKLHVADNNIDLYTQFVDKHNPVFISQILAQLICGAEKTIEIDLEGNQIGEIAASNILQALITRNEENLPKMKLNVTYRLTSDVFLQILKLSGTVQKKKAYKKSKKK